MEATDTENNYIELHAPNKFHIAENKNMAVSGMGDACEIKQ